MDTNRWKDLRGEFCLHRALVFFYLGQATGHETVFVRTERHLSEIDLTAYVSRLQQHQQ